MFGWIDLKAAMASCWKVSWNVDPLPLSVPLRLAEPPDEEEEEDEPPLGGELLLDEEHAPRVSASATTEIPAAVTCCLYRSCISQYSFFRPQSAQPRTAGLPLNRGVRVQSVRAASTCGQTEYGLQGTRKLSSGVLVCSRLAGRAESEAGATVTRVPYWA